MDMTKAILAAALAGFTVIETKTDPAYQRYTGIEGRICMVKVLSNEI